MSSTTRGRTYAYLRDYFSLARLRSNFRNRSWILTRGGSTLKIARRILEPFRPHLESIYGAKDKARVYFTKWSFELGALLTLGGCSERNNVEVYNDGSKFFEALWGAIDTAKKNIYLETYTMEPDATGLKTMQKLKEAAVRGCDVRIIVDGFGSSTLKPQYYEELVKTGATVHVFNPPNLYYYWRSWTRNHRKLAIVDDKVGFTGGMNISDKYSAKALEEKDLEHLSESEKYETRRGMFRDTHSKIVGPAVNDLLVSFLETYEEVENLHRFRFKPREWRKEGGLRAMWRKYKGYRQKQKQKMMILHSNKLSKSMPGDEHQSTINELELQARTEESSVLRDPVTGAPIFQNVRVEILNIIEEEEDEVHEEEEEEEDEGVFLQILSSHPRRARKNLHIAVHRGISQAGKNCYISTPYFYPPRSLTRAIFQAVDNGCDVRIMTSGISDVPFVKLAYLGIFGNFLKKGVRMYEYNARTLHAKYLSVDGLLSSVGSYNLDRVSYFTNLEVGWLAFDTQLASTMESHFQEDLSKSKEITMDDWLRYPWYQRWASQFLMFLMFVLGP